MFVSKRRFILKTCGTTLLLQALVPLLELAREYCGFDTIEVRRTSHRPRVCRLISCTDLFFICLSSNQNFFYSRKNFMKPAHQEFPHRNFQEEVDFLSQIFPSKCLDFHRKFQYFFILEHDQKSDFLYVQNNTSVGALDEDGPNAAGCVSFWLMVMSDSKNKPKFFQKPNLIHLNLLF